MATEWHVTRDGKTKGPFSSSKLKALADSGKLLPSDLLWKEGMKEPAPAESLNGLFAAASSKTDAEMSNPPPPQTPVQHPQHEPSALAEPAVLQTDAVEDLQKPKAGAGGVARLKTVLGSLGKASAHAGRLALLEAEKTKILNVELPPLYADFGRYVYEKAPDVQHRHTALSTKVQELRRTTEDPTPVNDRQGTVTGMAGRLAAATQNVTAIAASKVKQAQLFQAYCELGQAAFADYAEEPSFLDSTSSISRCRKRLEEISGALNEIEKETVGRVVTPRRLAFAGVAVGVLLVVMWARTPTADRTNEREVLTGTSTTQGTTIRGKRTTPVDVGLTKKQFLNKLRVAVLSTKNSKFDVDVVAGTEFAGQVFCTSLVPVIAMVGEPSQKLIAKNGGRWWLYECVDGRVVVNIVGTPPNVVLRFIPGVGREWESWRQEAQSFE